MRWSLLLLAGCGRLGFDALATSDAVTLANHDEDGDGVDDALDTCPHLSGDQSDLDGDGVGDLCDPEPSQPRQSRDVFMAMTSNDAPVPVADWQQDADAWRFSKELEGVSFDLPATLANANVWIGFDLIAILPEPRRQLFAAVRDDSDRYYYGEIYDDGTMMPRQTLLYFDGSVPVFFDSSVSLGTSVPLGPMDYHLAIRTVPEPVVTLNMTWPPLPPFRTDLTPAEAANFVGGDTLEIVARSLTVDVRYIFVVATRP